MASLEDNIIIGPKVNILSEYHPLEVSKRKTLVQGAVYNKQNAWIGVGATILPDLTVGENSVVTAGAVETKDVAPNTVVAGVPSRQVREL